jgi:hypothetical protein
MNCPYQLPTAVRTPSGSSGVTRPLAIFLCLTSIIPALAAVYHLALEAAIRRRRARGVAPEVYRDCVIFAHLKKVSSGPYNWSSTS